MQKFKKMNKKKLEIYFRIACYAECTSCFLLFLVAMPLKYCLSNTLFMIPAGMIHGLFFSTYIILAILVRKLYKWDDEDFVFVLMSAFFPFATLWVEKKLAKINR
jgi:integral membrane protein